jgi:hypothetical protein
VARGEQLLQDALTATHDIGASHMVGVIYSALRKYSAPCSAMARQNVVTTLQVCDPSPLVDSINRASCSLTCSSCAAW